MAAKIRHRFHPVQNEPGASAIGARQTADQSGRQGRLSGAEGGDQIIEGGRWKVPAGQDRAPCPGRSHGGKAGGQPGHGLFGQAAIGGDLATVDIQERRAVRPVV